MKMISYKRELICIGSLDEILTLINNDKKNIFSIDIKEEEPLTVFDLNKGTLYRVKIVYKRVDM